ncbi:TonB-dependent receptor [Sphingomonas bacterium]|uniref:TonB-dependent receptor n=1 Tax=Sphingomonas bacterium TaxID=1895847 RepID=UPI00262BC010|nr:TonB-dependent receptor [Sphingomonas bacterium]MDB5678654.1 putative TonB-dependent siderophore receptor [Sphingomonas bacterium]
MTISTRALLRASLAVLASTAAMPAWAADDSVPDTDPGKDDILIVAQRQKQTIENTPNAAASVDADRIARTVNAMNVEDTVKYLPSLIVRKRHIGDTQAPLATRTSGLGASARSLIYADGALLSALIGNNNTSASPRWSAVSPQEIARIDVLYGPFSAAYPGNSIGAVVNITTRLPDALEATLSAGTSVQTSDLYGRNDTFAAYQVGATVGDRFGPLALFASYDHVKSRGQPLGFATATTAPAGTEGGPADVNRVGQPLRVLGATGIEDQGQDRLKLKAAIDLTSSLRLTYVGGLFLNRTDSSSQTYLTTIATGAPNWPLALSAGVYRTDQRHWSHALSLGGSGKAFDWQVIGTRYIVDRDEQRIAATALPAAATGGAGTITRLDGTGWITLDAKAVWRSGPSALSFGAHWDRFRIASNRFTTTDWVAGSAGALNLQSLGKTRTAALWVQDAWKILPSVTLTLGGRYEWWRAYDGVNFSLSPAIAVNQPERSAAKFSPKAALAWEPAAGWKAQLAFGQAWRFPTVGELYQIVTTPVAAVPNPDLRPERARSTEVSIERTGKRGSIRLSLFNEVVTDALISQTGPLNGGPALATFVQNVDRTRARGVELAVVRNDLIPRFDLSGSVTYADATTRANAALPASVGKLIPTVPRWKATAVATWRPVDGVALTAAGRYSSRLYGTLDNSDVVGNTYQGFYKFLVVDLRAQFAVGKKYTLGIGVDNVTNDRYFLFHPFPQRTFHADLTLRL